MSSVRFELNEILRTTKINYFVGRHEKPRNSKKKKEKIFKLLTPNRVPEMQMMIHSFRCQVLAVCLESERNDVSLLSPFTSDDAHAILLCIVSSAIQIQRFYVARIFVTRIYHALFRVRDARSILYRAF